MDELMQWCLQRVPGREARHRRVPELLEYFQEFFTEIKIITVAGTAGKGSTCHMLETVLITDGKTVGMSVKPHLYSWCERFRINGVNVGQSELSEEVQAIFPRLQAFVHEHGEEYQPSLFESLIIIALSIYQKHGVEIAIFEAGVGGSNDATSFLPAIASVITSVGLDHQNELGNTIEEIARDKAGIAPVGGTLILGAGISDPAKSVIVSECQRRDVKVIIVGGHLPGIGLSLAGEHQQRNLATVSAIAEYLKLPMPRNLHVNIPGRFEWRPGLPSYLLDVAHNPIAIDSLIATIQKYHSINDLIVILGATEPHDYRYFVNAFAALKIPIGFCEGFPKAVSASTLVSCLPADRQPFSMFHTPAEAIAYFKQNPAYADKTIVVTGSLFLVGLWRYKLGVV